MGTRGYIADPSTFLGGGGPDFFPGQRYIGEFAAQKRLADSLGPNWRPNGFI